jgi:hypothetical protein
MDRRAYERMDSADPSPDLDLWLPGAQVRTRHEREASAPAHDLWAAAAQVELRDAGKLGRLVRWRLPGLPADQRFRAMFANPPFTVLGEGERWLVSGLAGRIWTFARDYPVLDGPEAFRDWDCPGTVRVLFGHWVRSAGRDRSVIVSEARVAPTDRVAALRLRGLWAVIGPFERLIGGEALAPVVARAEADARL